MSRRMAKINQIFMAAQWLWGKLDLIRFTSSASSWHRRTCMKQSDINEDWEPIRSPRTLRSSSFNSTTHLMAKFLKCRHQVSDCRSTQPHVISRLSRAIPSLACQFKSSLFPSFLSLLNHFWLPSEHTACLLSNHKFH